MNMHYIFVRKISNLLLQYNVKRGKRSALGRRGTLMKSMHQAQEEEEEDIMSGRNEDEFKENNPTKERTKKVRIQLDDTYGFPNDN